MLFAISDSQGRLLILAVIVCIAVYFTRKPKLALTACGTAMWATREMLKKANMLNAKHGIILGYTMEPPKLGPMWKKEKKPPLVRLPDAVVHTAIFAPTRVGKGVSYILPWLLSVNESCVCIDLKNGENALLTCAAREAMGQKVVLLDPFGVIAPKLGKKSDTFNPLDFIDADDPLGLDQCRSAAAAIVVRDNDDGKSRHFDDKAEERISAYMAVTVAYGSRDTNMRSLQDVAGIISNPDKAKLAEELMKQSSHWDGMLARAGYDLGNPQGEELASIKSVSGKHLRFLSSPMIAANTRTSTFDPGLLKRGNRKMTIYVALPLDQVGPCRPLLRLWIESFTRAVIREGLGEERKVHLMLDEAKTLGHMDTLEQCLDKYAGYGLRGHFIYQSMGHLKPCWPADQGQALLSNTTQIFMGTNDLETATYISRRCGNFTNVVESGGTNRGRGESWSHGAQPGGGSSNWGSSNSWQQQARELLKPEEVLSLPPRMAITFVAGMYPIRTWLLRWFEEPELRKLVEGPKRRQKFGLLKVAVMVILILLGLAVLAMN